MPQTKLTLQDKGMARTVNSGESVNMNFLAGKLIEAIVDQFDAKSYPSVTVAKNEDGDILITMHQRYIQSKFTHIFVNSSNELEKSLAGKITFFLEPDFPAKTVPEEILTLIFDKRRGVSVYAYPCTDFSIEEDNSRLGHASRFVLDHLLYEVQSRLDKV